MTPTPIEPMRYIGCSYKDKGWVCSNPCSNINCEYHPYKKEEPTNDGPKNA